MTQSTSQSPSDTSSAIVKQEGRELLDRSKLPPDRRGALAEPIITSLIDVRDLGDLTRFQVGVKLFPLHQYAISAGREKTIKTRDDGSEYESWKTVKAVHPNGSGYDHLNRVVGVQFVMPAEVHDQEGRPHRNPIHRKDYLYLSLIGIYRNDVGQLTSYREDIEVDFQRLYEEARMNASWNEPTTWVSREDPNTVVTDRPPGSNAKVDEKWVYTKGAEHRALDVIVFLRDEETGKPKQDQDGMPIYRLNLPEDVEAKCTQRLYDLRRFGLRYAYTVAKNRIMAAATGIKRLPIDDKGEVVISVAAWRDLLAPSEREKQAKEAARGVWGAPIGENVAGLDDTAMAEAMDDVVAGEYTDVTNLEEDVQSGAGPTPEEQEEIRRREFAEAEQS